tara:strand:+ start:1334 stop:4522 length:3189 start_codon:yes stop_codon:yes gene_type:complete
MFRKHLSFTTIFSISSLCFFYQRGFSNEVSFNRDIRPILSSKCFFCHGPSEKSRKANLRLDLEEEAFKKRDGIAAFVANSLDESEAWHRVISDDPEEVMPPPEFKKELTKSEIKTIKAWIEQGAKWEGHWAFIPVKKTPEPVTDIPNWVRNPIDSFVLHTHKDKGLSPSPEADRRTLIRRVYFDLTGLPPTPGEINDFLLDHSANAYEKVVDRLMNSNAYAERMTLVWMDASRYGDTSVFHDDGPRDMWPWRDWVLNAYKNNMPFDQFSIEQLAGDLLPEATEAQKIASGFNRNHATTDEGGVIAEEFRVEYVVDRVKTTGNVWMGLTMECAQCHDHKYDPISQEEYFKFYAFYNNNSDPGMQTRRGNTAPMIEIITPERKKQLDALAQQQEELLTKLDSRKKEMDSQFLKWAQEAASKLDENNSALEPSDLVAHLPLDDFTDNKTVDLIRETNSCKLNGKAKIIGQAKFGGGIKIEGNGFLEVNNFGNLEHNQSFSYGAWVKIPKDNFGGAILAKMDEGNDFRGYDLWMEGGKVGLHVINKWPSNALKVVSKAKAPIKKWTHLFVTYNGNAKVDGVEIYIDGKKQEKATQQDSLSETIITDKPLRLGRRFNSAQTNGAEIDDVRFYSRSLSPLEVQVISNSDPISPILAITENNRTKAQKEILVSHYFESKDKTYQKIFRQKKDTEKSLEELRNKKLTSMIMGDNPPNKTRKTYVLMRGQYASPDKSKEILPDTPAFLPPMKEELPKNRLGLANWLMDKDHPLTARVTVNRYWQTIFGRPLVSTPGDFGSQGSWPTHPQLLTWLAKDFIDHGWNIKRTIKQMVMSSTYRQASITRPEHSRKDPLNLYHARAPRFRLMGEFVRDNALAISGLLNRTFGGPGVKPYQPPGLWVEVSLSGGRRFVRDKGENLYRRSMYTYWKRSAPHPGLMAFDTPTRETCTLQRQRTNTPMQALVTLNDDQFIEASRAFAQRILNSPAKSFSDRINWAFEVATGHPADDLRREVLKDAFEYQKEVFTKEPNRADELLKIGETVRDTSVNVQEHATWTILASMILNLDETLNRE